MVLPRVSRALLERCLSSLQMRLVTTSTTPFAAHVLLVARAKLGPLGALSAKRESSRTPLGHTSAALAMLVQTPPLRAQPYAAHACQESTVKVVQKCAQIATQVSLRQISVKIHVRHVQLARLLVTWDR